MGALCSSLDGDDVPTIRRPANIAPADHRVLTTTEIYHGSMSRLQQPGLHGSSPSSALPPPIARPDWRHGATLRSPEGILVCRLYLVSCKSATWALGIL